MASADPLREKLKALVEEWREDVADKRLRQSTRSSVLYCADQLAALLAESEPVDWSQPQELVITADGPLEPEPPCSCKSRQARGALAPR